MFGEMRADGLGAKALATFRRRSVRLSNVCEGVGLILMSACDQVQPGMCMHSDRAMRSA